MSKKNSESSVEVCIIIPSFNNEELLRDCLSSIKKNTQDIEYKVIVVDDFSDEECTQNIKRKFPWINLLNNQTNLGFSKSCNRGIKFAYKKYNPDYYYFLNNDTKVTKYWLEKIVSFARANKNGGAFGSRQVGFDGGRIVYAGNYGFFGNKYYYCEKPRIVEWLCGAGFMVSREALEKVGLFDEIYSPGYYEESDLLQRIKKRNFEVWVVPFSLIYHKVGATTGKGAFLNKKDFFYQHEIIFYMRYFPIFFIFRFFKSIMRAIIEKRVFFLLKSYKKGWDKRKEKQINFLSN